MKRRTFAKTIAAGAVGGVVGGAILGREKVYAAGAPAPAKRAVLMKVGCQSRGTTTKENMEYLARHGVYHVRLGTTQGDL